jgi:hypothetical protein
MPKRTFCVACNTHHAKRITDQHRRELKRSKNLHHQEAKHDPSGHTEFNACNDFSPVPPIARAKKPSSVPPSWTAAGLTEPLYYIISYFFYICLLNTLSSDAVDLFLPLLTIFAPELICFSVDALKKLVGIGDHKFTKFVVCPKCAALKTMNEFRTDPICRVQHFANRPRCNTPMGKEQRLLSGQIKLVPLQIFAYNSVTEQLKRFFARPGFSDKLEKWRCRRTRSGTLADVYDGNIWKEFHNYKGSPFLSAPGNLALQLNYDGFQPYKRRVYSVGAVYLCILNLPRSER